MIRHFDTEFSDRYLLSRLKSVHVLRTKHISYTESVAWSYVSLWLLTLNTACEGSKDGMCVSEVIKSYVADDAVSSDK